MTPCSGGKIKIVSYLVPGLTVLTGRQTITSAESQNKIKKYCSTEQSRSGCWVGGGNIVGNIEY